MTTRIKLRRDTAANWLDANPILAAGEPGLETDTGKIKYGDGETAWADLPHAGGDTLTDDGSVVVTAGSTEHWIATQRRDQYDVRPRALRYDSQGNLYTLTDTSDNENSIVAVTKYTPAGAVAWQKTITNRGALNLAIDSSDQAYVVTKFGVELQIIKFSTTGSVLWDKNYNYDDGADLQDAYIEEKTSTSLVVVATVNGPFPAYALLLDISTTNGSVNTQRTLERDGSNVFPTGIDVTDNGTTVYVTGYYYDGGDGKDKMFIEKMNSSFVRIWSKSLDSGTNYNMYGGDCASDALGNIYAVGTYSVATTNENGGQSSASAGILTKLNSSGDVQWTRRIGPGPCGGFATGLTVTDAGEVYLSAITFTKKADGIYVDAEQFLQTAYGDNKLIVARYTTQGAVIWQRYVDVAHLYEDFDSENVRGQAVAVFDDKFVVDGYGNSSNTTPWNWSGTDDYEDDYFVVQLPTDGTELTIGDLQFTESRVPGRFVTHATVDVSSTMVLATDSTTLAVTDFSTVIDSETRIANNIVKSEVYQYTFGADGTLNIPNDGDLRLTQTQVGYLAAIGGAQNYNNDMQGRAVTVDSQGNMYVVGSQDDNYQPWVMKISPAGEMLWGVSIQEDDNGNDGRANGVKIHPSTGNVMVVCEFYGNYTYSALVTIDQDTGRILYNQTFTDADADVYLNDIAFDSNGEYVLAGSKYGEFSAEIPVTAQTGSTTGVIQILRSDVEGEPYNWQIGGTGFSVFENVAYVERYAGLTGTVQQGSGATFDIINNGNGTYSAGIVSGGTNYRVGHKIKILGTSLTGAENTTNFASGTDYTAGDYKVFSDGLTSYFALQSDSVDPANTKTLLTNGSVISINEASLGTVSTAITGSYGAISGTSYYGWALTSNIGGAGLDTNINNFVTGYGTTLSGATPANDIIITVQAVDGSGAITGVGNSGTAAGTFTATATAVSGTNTDVGSGFTVTFESSRYNANYSNYWNYNITNVGTNYADGDVIVIPGTSLGGTSPENDLTWTAYASGGSVYSSYSIAGTGQTSTWKLETTTQVDFSGEGSWSITYPLSRENLLITDGWTRTFGTTADSTDRLYAVAVDSGNNVIAVGQGYGLLSEGNNDDLAMVFKFNSSGTLQWARKLNERDYDCYAMSVITIGTDIYVTHDSNDNGETVITKLDATGTVKWQRITDSNDDSVIARTADGNLLVTCEAYNNDIGDDALKVFLLTPGGEVVYKRWLMATTDSDSRFKNGRCLTTDNDSFYITSYFYANDYDSTMIARLPIDGSGTGEHGSFRYTDVNAMTGSFSDSGLTGINYDIDPVNLEDENNYAGPLADGEEVYIKTTSTFTTGEGDLYVDTFYPNYNVETVRDTDGGNIVFADGTTQNTSATDIPQRRYLGQRYTLGLKDRGHHIYCVNQNEEILIPYNARVEFPVGTVITIVNSDSSSVYINKEGGSMGLMIVGEGYYDYVELTQYGMATLLKVGRDQWVIAGNVQSN